MSGIDKIIEDAERRAKEMVEAANREAIAIIKDAEKKWLEKAEAERRKAVESARREASVIISEAKRTASFIVARAKEATVREVFEKAWELIEREEYDVRLSLRNLILESINYIGKPVKVLSSSRRLEVVKEILAELGYREVQVEPSPNVREGIIVVSEGGTLVDNRLETRLEQSKLRLVDKVARILWG
ncbi:MAG: V-type ATP synthase subunit E [Desulfurococcaceae archaeon]